ncbi:hypothetical protein IL38_23510 [Actinopolyspora erythraea]|uniref:Uncharacterized protein n=1 Tax=Actinopolyspora erythraea TaxID=414996 RepID=A0ABR4WYZ5_9ACTN|nr:hypothetical protein IL38_23510 [Actinopolyspora erythraea]
MEFRRPGFRRAFDGTSLGACEPVRGSGGSARASGWFERGACRARAGNGPHFAGPRNSSRRTSRFRAALVTSGRTVTVGER